MGLNNINSFTLNLIRLNVGFFIYMSLVIDIGNTRVKVAKFKNKELLKVVFLKQNEVLNELKKLNFKSGIISNVGAPLTDFLPKELVDLFDEGKKTDAQLFNKYDDINEKVQEEI